jgi:threonine dehydratase
MYAMPVARIMITRQELDRARTVIAGHVHRTPLLSVASVGARCGVRLHVKCENLQKTGSYKPRGGLNRLAQLDPQEKRRGVIVMSAGNLAQGVAYAARQAGVHCWVSMLATASAAKIEAVRGYGAEVVLHPDPATWFEGVEALRVEHGAVLIDAWADAALIAGYGSIGSEILEELPDVEVVVVPVGGGTLISGIATAIKLARPSVHVVGVECASGRLVHDSVAAGKPLRLARSPSIADGLSSPTTSDLVVATVQRYVDDLVAVSDDEIREAMRVLLQRGKLLVEGAGASAVAALLAGRTEWQSGRTVVAVLSGGNVDFARLQDVLGHDDRP